MATYQHGKSCPVALTPSGLSLVTLNVTDHTWAEEIEETDVTDTGAGGVQQLIAGILRGDGTVKAWLDTTAMLTLSSGAAVRAGGIGVMKHFVTATLFYQVPYLIKRVNSVVPHNGAVGFEFAVRLNGLAGSVAYPS